MTNQNLSFLCFTLLISSFFFAFAAAELCHPQDKAALLAVKAGFNNPRILRTWTPDTDCCTSWSSVSCNKTNNNRIWFAKILYSHQVTGQISPAIGDLPYLQILAISKLPNVNGTIPESITKLTNLQSLDISYTGIGGTVPEFLSRMTNLETLVLTGNKFTGPLPTFWIQMPNLQVINIDKNRFTGTIPEIYGSFSSPIIYVTVAGNQLTGTVPRVFKNGNFSTLDISNNKLTGDPSFLFQNKNLFGYLLAGNEFSFDMSRVKINFGVQDIDIRRNKIYGKLPASLTKISLLNTFNVSYNNLCGQIPVGGVMQSLDASAFIHNKCLCGAPLPAC